MRAALPRGLAPRSQRPLSSRRADLHVRLDPALLSPSSTTPLELSVLPSLRTLLLRTQISRLTGRQLPKSKYHLTAVLQPGPSERGERGEEVRVEIPPAEESKEVSWWGIEDGDAVEVVAV